MGGDRDEREGVPRGVPARAPRRPRRRTTFNRRGEAGCRPSRPTPRPRWPRPWRTSRSPTSRATRGSTRSTSTRRRSKSRAWPSTLRSSRSESKSDRRARIEERIASDPHTRPAVLRRGAGAARRGPRRNARVHPRRAAVSGFRPGHRLPVHAERGLRDRAPRSASPRGELQAHGRGRRRDGRAGPAARRHRRAGSCHPRRPAEGAKTPPALASFAHLFGPHLDDAGRRGRRRRRRICLRSR